MYVGNAFLLLLNLPLVGLFVRALTVPRWVLIPGVSALAFVAVYAVNASAFDLVLMTLFGVVGYLMRTFDFPLAPVVLGLVLGPLMEKNLRRAMALSAATGVCSSTPPSRSPCGHWHWRASSLRFFSVDGRTMCPEPRTRNTEHREMKSETYEPLLSRRLFVRVVGASTLIGGAPGVREP